MSTNPNLTPREAEVVTLLAEGMTPKRVAEELQVISVSRHISIAKHKAGVTTRRGLIYVCLAREWIPRPAPHESPVEIDEETACLWAGLRLDVRESRLVPTLANLVRIAEQRVKEVLRTLEDRHSVTRCGLIRIGYAQGLLSGLEGHRLPRRTARDASPDWGASAPGTDREPMRGAEVTPRPGPARTGPWRLTGRQGDAMDALVTSRSLEEGAEQFGVSPESFRRHLKKIAQVASVTTVRALMHRALQDGQLAVPAHIPAPVTTDLTPEARTVWRHLVLDVEDHELEAEIARATGLSRGQVCAALEQLPRFKEEPGWQLIIQGWACGVITARDEVVLPNRAPRLNEFSARPARSRQPAVSPQRTVVSRTDLLRLLPGGVNLPVFEFSGCEGAPPETEIVTGQDYDLVRVTPDACGQLLAGTPTERWGPVIVSTEANTALFVTAPGVLTPGWRARYGRLWRAGARVELPPEHHPGPGGMHWVVSCRAPLWSAAHLEQLLNHLPVPAVSPRAPRGDRW
ncbi:LuxR C-terminal-related transcriptional regulator [Streptomyces sp. NPDC051662]|uniref:response regulator transcription factor n=1 Tax=Streptomyces sp. NPDC051662 TaxID=3154750 RepID=UPI00342F9413